jgi:hypothetical protein
MLTPRGVADVQVTPLSVQLRYGVRRRSRLHRLKGGRATTSPAFPASAVDEAAS